AKPSSGWWSTEMRSTSCSRSTLKTDEYRRWETTTALLRPSSRRPFPVSEPAHAKRFLFQEVLDHNRGTLIMHSSLRSHGRGHGCAHCDMANPRTPPRLHDASG